MPISFRGKLLDASRDLKDDRVTLVIEVVGGSNPLNDWSKVPDSLWASLLGDSRPVSIELTPAWEVTR